MKRQRLKGAASAEEQLQGSSNVLSLAMFVVPIKGRTAATGLKNGFGNRQFSTLIDSINFLFFYSCWVL
jgi:hypothetical protein